MNIAIGDRVLIDRNADWREHIGGDLVLDVVGLKGEEVLLVRAPDDVESGSGWSDWDEHDRTFLMHESYVREVLPKPLRISEEDFSEMFAGDEQFEPGRIHTDMMALNT